MNFNLCHSCSIAVVNGDLTHMNSNDAEAVTTFMDEVGLLCTVGPADLDSNCDACDCSMDEGTEFEQM